MKTTCILALAAALLQGRCIQVPSGQIVAGDLAGTIPLFRTLDPQTPLGFAPVPGVQRILTAHELALAARRYQIAVDAGTQLPSVCVERAVQPLSRDDLVDAMQAGLGIAGARVELLEFGGQPAPPGRLEFRRATLPRPAEAPAGAVVWRGRLVYDGQRSVSVWAKVRITAEQRILVAAQNVPAGTVIRADQVQEIQRWEFPFPGPAPSREQVVGKVALRSIAAGQRFTPQALAEAKDVRPGETVRVRVVDGLATLTLEAVAQSSGNKGDMVQIHNPSSGKNFRAQVEDKGKVLVNSSEGAP
jgi:flagella basal body P-ring formation protein FlgA